MSGITALQPVSMGFLSDSRAYEDILSDLRVEWIKIAIELELDAIMRHRFPGHSQVARNRLERLIDELRFVGLEAQFRAQRLWREVTGWCAAGALKFWLNLSLRPHRRRVKISFMSSIFRNFRSQYFWARG
jgi:hypothetical protein